MVAPIIGTGSESTAAAAAARDGGKGTMVGGVVNGMVVDEIRGIVVVEGKEDGRSGDK